MLASRFAALAVFAPDGGAGEGAKAAIWREARDLFVCRDALSAEQSVTHDQDQESVPVAHARRCGERFAEFSVPAAVGVCLAAASAGAQFILLERIGADAEPLSAQGVLLGVVVGAAVGR